MVGASDEAVKRSDIWPRRSRGESLLKVLESSEEPEDL